MPITIVLITAGRLSANPYILITQFTSSMLIISAVWKFTCHKMLIRATRLHQKSLSLHQEYLARIQLHVTETTIQTELILHQAHETAQNIVEQATQTATDIENRLYDNMHQQAQQHEQTQLARLQQEVDRLIHTSNTPSYTLVTFIIDPREYLKHQN